MIITKLMGGLGNQMFQYAFGKFLAEKHSTILKMDTAFLLDRTPRGDGFVFRDYDLSIFNVDESFANREEVDRLTRRTSNPQIDRILNKLIGERRSYIKEKSPDFSTEYLEAGDDSYLEGYWQSEKYFAPISEKLKRKDLTFRNPVEEKTAALLDRVASSNSVCVNVRRGDFITDSHGTMRAEYYTEGEQLLLESHADLELFVFSDDIEWCMENLKFKSPVSFVSHEHAGHKFSDYLRLMSACKHFIIPNSSFAWWAVWFSDNREKTVIAPRRWFMELKYSMGDLIPESWIRL